MAAAEMTCLITCSTSAQVTRPLLRHTGVVPTCAVPRYRQTKDGEDYVAALKLTPYNAPVYQMKQCRNELLEQRLGVRANAMMYDAEARLLRSVVRVTLEQACIIEAARICRRGAGRKLYRPDESKLA